jgi:hypothetical protein
VTNDDAPHDTASALGPPYDAGNRRHVERRTRLRKLRERRVAEAFRWLMADARGRLLMWERLSEAGVFRSSIAPSAELTAFREGRRDMGLRDLDLIMRLCPEQYARMAAEQQASSVPGNSSSGDGDAE